MSNIKTFFFNGQKYQTKQLITLNDLLNYFDYQSSLFVLEYNNFICNKEEWEKIYIQSNDKIELISIVGGG